MDKDLKEKIEMLKMVCARGMIECACQSASTSDSIEGISTALKQATLAIKLMSGEDSPYDLIFLSLAKGFDALKSEFGDVFKDVSVDPDQIEKIKESFIKKEGGEEDE